MKTNIARSFPVLIALGIIPIVAGGCAADGTYGAEETSATSEELSKLPMLPVDPGGGAGPIDPVPTPVTPAPVTPAPVTPPAPLVVTEVAKGDGWSHTTAVGNGFDVDGTPIPYNGNYWMFKTRTALSTTAALPPATMAALRTSMGPGTPAADDDEMIIIPKKSVDAYEAQVAGSSAASNGGLKSEFQICNHSQDGLFSKTFQLDRQFNYTKTADGNGFTGHADLGAHVVGSMTGSISYTKKYLCLIPYIVVHKVSVEGHAKVIGDANIDAEFARAWSFSQQIADPTLATVPLPVIPIPIVFSLPVSVGLDATAKASVKASAEFRAQGDFEIDCRWSGCDGNKSGSAGFDFNGAPVVSAQATMHVTPWAEVDLKASVVTGSLASARVGVRAEMPSDVFAYAGNTCGDADGDGVNEFVSGAAFNTNLSINLKADAQVIGHSLVSRSYPLWNSGGGFHMVANGGVFDPILRVNGLPGTISAEAKASMRPCWPYDDIAIYEVNWGDGTTTPVSNQVHTFFDLTHDYASAGTKSITVKALNDIGGRELGSTTSHDATVGGIFHLPPGVGL